MKKILLSIIAFFLVFGLVSAVMAEVNSVTPSTNDINRTNNWAHVDQLSMGIGTTDLQFISTRPFFSCFEYRTDGDTTQKIGDTNYNTLVTDGLYPYYCQNNSSSTHTIAANQYVEIRMVFGAEGDERFDWTRFNVIYPVSGEITNPVSDGDHVSGNLVLTATYDDGDNVNDDAVNWAVRHGTCAANTGTAFGNVDGYSDPYDWTGSSFTATIDTTGLIFGDSYCFVFNPTDDAGQTDVRLTRTFIVDEPVIGPPSDKNQCKENGWTTFNSPSFKNQGDCVSYVQSSPNAKGNKLK